MYLKNIPKRGILKYYAVVFFIFLIIECFFSLFIQNLFYENAKSFVTMKSSDIDILFSDDKVYSNEELYSKISAYLKNFNDENFLDVSAFDKNGNRFLSINNVGESFLDLNNTIMQTNSPYLHIENLKNGTCAIILIKGIRDNLGNIVGALKYVFPLDKTNRLIFWI